MMNVRFKNSLLSWISRRRIHQIEFFKKNPYEIQSNVLNSLINRAQSTYFGDIHKFRYIKSYSDFIKHVPTHTYEELFPYIKKSREGNRNILWPGRMNWFAVSSGTTNDKSKYIPVSIEALKECHFKGGKDMLSLYCTNYPKTQIYQGKSLMIGGSQRYNTEYSFMEGDLSAILIHNFPFWVNMHRTPGIEVALMQDWEKKLSFICNQSVKQNVTNITGVPSWVLILFNKILKETGVDNILDIWPNLELYMHGGINFGPYKRRFQEMIPTETMNYLEGYNASEGFFGIQDQKDNKELLLMLDYGIFYEFIRLEDFNKGIRETIELRDVSIGSVYVIVISTNAGLWRYIIGDTIRFTSLNPYRIKLVGRTKSYINAFGEELMVENAEKAINICSSIHNCFVDNFIVAPEHHKYGKGRHHWLVEFSVKPDSIEFFANDLDKYLRDINSDYDAKRRNDTILKNLKITIANDSLFHSWLAKNNRLGGQHKVPRLDNSMQVFNDIMLLNNSIE